MRADEFTAEMAGSVQAGVRKVLQNKGYKYLGSGIDKQAWLEPDTGQVLIIFGYRKGVEGFSPDQHMFVDWINYCNKHKNNPHLPKFSGFESFQFQGKTYIQARMESLQELPAKVGYLVMHIEEAIGRISRGNYDNALAMITSWAALSSRNDRTFELYDIEKSIELLGGPEKARGLLKTVHDVRKLGFKKKLSIDLHRGNYMLRPDGTIVVNDPFVVWVS